MSLDHGYAVLKGHAIDGRPARNTKEHYSIHVVDDHAHYRLAVNIRSLAKNFGPDLFFYLDEDFQHPLLDDLRALPMGRRVFGANAPREERRDSGIALDFIRMNLFDRNRMQIVPGILSGPNNDLNERIDGLVKDMMGDEDSLIYAFGEPWINEDKIDKYFGFHPGNGVHNLHMNQGDLTGDYAHEDGVYQDGGLIFHYPATGKYAAFFTKFQSQSWHTHDETGHPITGAGEDIAPQPHTGGQPHHGGGNPTGPGHDPDGQVRIIAALVNAVGQAPEAEFVTLLNTTAQPVDMAGWHLADKEKRKMPLAGSIPGGETVRVKVGSPMLLSNNGGIITLLNTQGVKVHGVSYTAQQADREGITITFGA